MKTLRFHLPVLAEEDVPELLQLVTDVDGVAAAMVDVSDAVLDVAVRSDAASLLVKRSVLDALLAGMNGATA